MELGHFPVQADHNTVVVIPEAVGPQVIHPPQEFLVVRCNDAPFARCHRFGARETEHLGVAEATYRSSVVF